MDAYSSKQAVGGIAAPKKRAVDTAGTQDGTSQFCNRLGCCGRLNHTKVTKNKCLEKPKPLKPSSRSSSGKEVMGSFSKNCSSVSHVKKSLATESSSVLDESEFQELNASGSRTGCKLKSGKTTEAASSSTKVRKVNQASQSGSTASSAITDQGVTKNSERNRYGLKSLRSNSISDGYRKGDRNNESDNGSRRRFFQGESSSSGKGKRVIGVAANEERAFVSAPRISISDPRNSRNWTACKASGVSSVRTRRSLYVDTSARSSINKIPENLHTETLWPSEEASSTELTHNGGSSTSDTSVSSTDNPIVRFMNHNGTQHYNIDGIADVLVALERMEQDEELTYEHLLSLEANLFLDGLNFYDQHRDMRLDIDDMSYEELLALEEKMGTVNTSLSEEELSKCIRIRIYESLHLEDGRMRCSWGSKDSKCSICQEEFVRGDEMGWLVCGHGYHSPCINQWLRLKNWCPVCKVSPQPLSSPA